MVTQASTAQIQAVIGAIPHRHPFRFLDSISALDIHSVEATYTFPADAWFYKGHFPDKPITPGVILTECMVQCGMLPIALFRIVAEGKILNGIPLLTLSEAEFLKPVWPGTTVIVKGTLEYWRRMSIRCQTEMLDSSGITVSLATLTATWINHEWST